MKNGLARVLATGENCILVKLKCFPDPDPDSAAAARTVSATKRRVEYGEARIVSWR